MLHGVINLLTQGSARTLQRVTRCLAFCQLTNPLTRPEHALLTPCSQTLLTLQLKGLSRGWDVGAEELQKALPTAWDLCADPHSRAGHVNRTHQFCHFLLGDFEQVTLPL